MGIRRFSNHFLKTSIGFIIKGRFHLPFLADLSQVIITIVSIKYQRPSRLWGHLDTLWFCTVVLGALGRRFESCRPDQSETGLPACLFYGNTPKVPLGSLLDIDSLVIALFLVFPAEHFSHFPRWSKVSNCSKEQNKSNQIWNDATNNLSFSKSKKRKYNKNPCPVISETY